MISIDGSYGEGGGQIIRTAVTLSAVTDQEVEVHNIRKHRPKPGLKPQHLTAIRTAADMTQGEVKGLEPGSTSLTFRPGTISGGHYHIDIRTAGSITLLLQCLMPAAAAAPRPVSFDITGGTDVAWSPSIDYLTNVLLPVLFDMGLNCSVQLLNRGYYPRGGGRVKVSIQPSAFTGLDIGPGSGDVTGISHSSNLPEHVVRRQADSAVETLKKAGYGSSIDVETTRQVSTGSGITLWCGRLGGSALGKPGLPAEQVGQSAAREIITELDSGAAVDVHLADQLIPYMALAGSGRFTVREINGHTRTNIWVVEQFLDVTFNIEKENGIYAISL